MIYIELLCAFAAHSYSLHHSEYAVLTRVSGFLYCSATRPQRQEEVADTNGALNCKLATSRLKGVRQFPAVPPMHNYGGFTRVCMADDVPL